ncbi:hypothetical protein BASA83_002732 [Batrachochytrium salamandrivorans]|nr:hypothetical protein BASA83_002732 [Batrachochytrium salamandrivorans]
MGSNLSRRVYPDTTSITSKQALLSARTDQNATSPSIAESCTTHNNNTAAPPLQSKSLTTPYVLASNQHTIPESSLDHADTQLTANRIRCLEDDRNKALVDKRRFAVLLSEVETVSATRCELIRGLEAELQAQANALHIQASAISDLKDFSQCSLTPLFVSVKSTNISRYCQARLLHMAKCIQSAAKPQYPTDLIKPCNTHTVTPDSFNMASPYTTSVEDQKALLLTDTLSKLIADYIQIAARLKASAATTLYSTDEALNADFISLALNDGLDQSANSGYIQLSF